MNQLNSKEKKKLDKTVHLRITTELYDIITNVSKKNCISESEILRQCISASLSPSSDLSSDYQLEIAKKVAINRLCNKILSISGISYNQKEIIIKRLFENE